MNDTERQERDGFLREGRAAMERQERGPMDRGDGATILQTLRALLDDIRDGRLRFVDRD